MQRFQYAALAVVLLFSLLFSACQLLTESNEQGDRVTLVHKVDSVEIVSLTDEQVVLRTVSIVPNPCYYLHDVTQNISANALNVRIMAAIDKETICVTILGQLETNITLNRKGLNQLPVTFAGQIADFDTTLVF